MLSDEHLFYLELYFQRCAFQAFLTEMEIWICVMGRVKTVCVFMAVNTRGSSHKADPWVFFEPH